MTLDPLALAREALADVKLRREVVEAIDDEVGGEREIHARIVIRDMTRRRLDREPVLAQALIEAHRELEEMRAALAEACHYAEKYIGFVGTVSSVPSSDDPIRARIAALRAVGVKP